MPVQPVTGSLISKDRPHLRIQTSEVDYYYFETLLVVEDLLFKRDVHSLKARKQLHCGAFCLLPAHRKTKKNNLVFLYHCALKISLHAAATGSSSHSATELKDRTRPRSQQKNTFSAFFMCGEKTKSCTVSCLYF